MYDCFVLTCFSRNTQTLLIDIPIKWPAYNEQSYLWLFLSPNMFRYMFDQILGIQIYKDIRSVKSRTSEYIQIFVRSVLGLLNIFGYLFEPMLRYLPITALNCTSSHCTAGVCWPPLVQMSSLTVQPQAAKSSGHKYGLKGCCLFGRSWSWRSMSHGFRLVPQLTVNEKGKHVLYQSRVNQVNS